MRADLESLAPGATAAGLAAVKTPTRQGLIADLHELVAALDRRVPRLERAAEGDIARDAAALRREALTRIAQLERSHAEL